MMKHCVIHYQPIDRRDCPWCQIEEMNEELEKWQNGSKKQADRIAQLEELLQKETLMHHAAHQRAEAAEEQLKKYEGCVEMEGKVYLYEYANTFKLCADLPFVFGKYVVNQSVTVWVKRRTE